MKTKEIEIEQNYVTFYSPGTMFAETNVIKVDSWDIEAAMEKARKIKQRHNATPYGFRFTTRGRAEDELDSKEIKSSPMYYLGGTVKTLAEVKAENDPSNKILILNMEGNDWDRVIENNNSWKVSQPLSKEDIVLDFKL